MQRREFPKDVPVVDKLPDRGDNRPAYDLARAQKHEAAAEIFAAFLFDDLGGTIVVGRIAM